MTELDYYFLGIAGTGMASAAGLLKDLGYNVGGCDEATYPPMSTMLEKMGLPIDAPGTVANIDAHAQSTFVIANRHSKNHPLVAHILAANYQYTSFPAILAKILQSRHSIVVAGTHGKTTTTTMLSFLLAELGHAPGFLIGGVPKHHPYSFCKGESDLFVIEGDEYNTAFFDKSSKFLHYHPKLLVLNNLEFDHADIFADEAAYIATFSKLIALTKPADSIVANIDSPLVRDLVANTVGVFRVATKDSSADLYIDHIQPPAATSTSLFTAPWRCLVKSELWPTFALTLPMAGEHNFANLAQALGSIAVLARSGKIPLPTSEALQTALHGFQTVNKRLNYLGETTQGAVVFEDFAHHPTAVAAAIRAMARTGATTPFDCCL